MENNSEEWDYQVLINDEGQHSLWPEFKAIPGGWKRVGPIGDKTTCLNWVEAHWTDMRPVSLRAKLSAN